MYNQKFSANQQTKREKEQAKEIKELRLALQDITDYVQGKPLGIVVRNDGEFTYRSTGKQLGEIIKNATKLL